MYKIENDQVISAPQNYGNISGFPIYLQNLSKEDRQSMGWFPLTITDSNVTVPTVDLESDLIRIPLVVIIPEPIDPRILALREEYKNSTHFICQIAGVEIKDKLEDEEYNVVVAKALTNDVMNTAMLTQTIMYCLFQLYRLDGDDAWNRI